MTMIFTRSACVLCVVGIVSNENFEVKERHAHTHTHTSPPSLSLFPLSLSLSLKLCVCVMRHNASSALNVPTSTFVGFGLMTVYFGGVRSTMVLLPRPLRRRRVGGEAQRGG